MSDTELILLFAVWYPVSISLIFFPWLFLFRENWLPKKKFTRRYRQFDWLMGRHSLFPAIWFPLSFVVTARQVENAEPPIFFFFVLLVPLIGFGIFKGICEASLGLSFHLRPKRNRKKLPAIRLVIFKQRHCLPPMEYYYLRNELLLRRIGSLRIVLGQS